MAAQPTARWLREGNEGWGKADTKSARPTDSDERSDSRLELPRKVVGAKAGDRYMCP